MASLTSGLPRPGASEAGLYQRDAWSWAGQQAEPLCRRALDEIEREFTGRNNIRDLDTLEKMAFLARAVVGKRRRYAGLVA